MNLVALVLAAPGDRVIDFVLANLVSSRVSTIYVITQSPSLVRHINTMWSGIAAGGRIRVLQPPSSHGAEPYQGSADAVYRNLPLIERHRPDAVAVLAMERVFRMDLREMAEVHDSRGAYATVAAVALPLQRARSSGVIATDADGRIIEFQEKPERPAPMPSDAGRAYVPMGSYLFDPDVLAGLLLWARKDGGNDFGRDVLPALASCPRVFAHDFAHDERSGVRPYEDAVHGHVPGRFRNGCTKIRNGLRQL